LNTLVVPQLCQEDDCYMFCWLVPLVYKEYPKFAIGNEKLLHLIVSTVDAKQLQEFACKVLQGELVENLYTVRTVIKRYCQCSRVPCIVGNLTMFRADMFVSLVTSSLSWETFEQFCLWQLAIAHNIPLESMMNTLPKLDFKAHTEALTAILLLLRREK
jgi:integrator complex subunit 3